MADGNPAFACDTSAEAHRLTSLLREDGHVIVPGIAPIDSVQALTQDIAQHFADTPFCQGEFYGNRTKRFGALLRRSVHAAGFVAHPLILDVVRQILGPFADTIQLNLTQALALHPGQIAQPPHRDQDMWRGAKGEIEYLVNVMWPFTPYTAENGATLLWPHSHSDLDKTAQALGDPIVAEMAPGDALLFLGSTLHAGGANSSRAVREGMIVSYCLGWLKPYENQWLVYPPDVARTFVPRLAELIGYQIHRPNLGNVEGQCPSILFNRSLDEPIGAVDHLTPEQVRLIAERRRTLADCDETVETIELSP